MTEADMTDHESALRAALPGFKGWCLERVEPNPEDDGQAEIGTSYDDGGFAPIITVNAGLYYANDRAMPLARAVSAACMAAPALLADVDRLRAEVEALRAVAVGDIQHIYAEGCPDELDRSSRDPNCPACRAIDAARAAHEPTNA